MSARFRGYLQPEVGRDPYERITVDASAWTVMVVRISASKHTEPEEPWFVLIVSGVHSFVPLWSTTECPVQGPVGSLSKARAESRTPAAKPGIACFAFQLVKLG